MAFRHFAIIAIWYKCWHYYICIFSLKTPINKKFYIHISTSLSILLYIPRDIHKLWCYKSISLKPSMQEFAAGREQQLLKSLIRFTRLRREVLFCFFYHLSAYLKQHREHIFLPHFCIIQNKRYNNISNHWYY